MPAVLRRLNSTVLVGCLTRVPPFPQNTLPDWYLSAPSAASCSLLRAATSAARSRSARCMTSER
jgi:hypothetical protein